MLPIKVQIPKIVSNNCTNQCGGPIPAEEMSPGVMRTVVLQDLPSNIVLLNGYLRIDGIICDEDYVIMLIYQIVCNPILFLNFTFCNQFDNHTALCESCIPLGRSLNPCKGGWNNFVNFIVTLNLNSYLWKYSYLILGFNSTETRFLLTGLLFEFHYADSILILIYNNILVLPNFITSPINIQSTEITIPITFQNYINYLTYECSLNMYIFILI